MIKLLYKPLGLLVSVLGGVLAGAIFKKAWKIAAGQDQAPQATDQQRGWGEVLLAAALQGAIFAVVKAAVDRGAATGVQKATGVWPGDEGEQTGDGQQAGRATT
jgi:predicted metal-dependent enzyme (double-stranded beta helix superfamily)